MQMSASLITLEGRNTISHIDPVSYAEQRSRKASLGSNNYITIGIKKDNWVLIVAWLRVVSPLNVVICSLSVLQLALFLMLFE